MIAANWNQSGNGKLAPPAPGEVARSITGRDYLSWSQVSTFQSCSLRWWFTQFVVSLGASHLEIRTALQNTLLDRISSRVLRHDETFEIDPAIPDKLSKDFRNRLHSLLTELSPR